MSEPNEINQQFAFVNNLFIGLSIGILTFLVHLAFSDSYHFDHRVDKAFVLSATATTFASLMFGVSLAWIRIEHFRLTGLLENALKNNEAPIIQRWARSEMLTRRLIRYQGFFLVLSSFLLFILAFFEFLVKGAG